MHGVWLLPLMLSVGMQAETGREAWLRYRPVKAVPSLPATVMRFGEGVATRSAQEELIRGVRGMLGRPLRVETRLPAESAILLGTVQDLQEALPALRLNADLAPDAYLLRSVGIHGVAHTVIAGANDRAVLYGVFRFLRALALGEPVNDLNRTEAPYAPIRWVNQWDNLDGSIERGYGGRSLFWDNLRVRSDLTRAAEYARLLASLGIGACTINNVNSNPRILTAEFIPQVAQIAAQFRPWGVHVAVAVDFGSPKSIGGLDSFDPADARVAAWWAAKADELYRAVPDLAGFVLKADSEGRVGPSTYGRTHAEAANVVARGLRPHNGLLFYRGFVYDHHMDWRNPKNDRARAAYDNFYPLDGKFDDNVILQIKNGPIDFQVREPVSPLIGALEKTNQALELQVTQEYMGQALHTVYLAPMWKEVLDFDMHSAGGRGTPVKALTAGRTFRRPSGGIVGVVNAGLDENWAGNHLSQANLYAFGRLAWNPDETAAAIARDWTRLTFGDDPEVLRTVLDIQLNSWRTYENYTGPLGLQTLTDITGNHYSAAVEASERNSWGQWHNATDEGVGLDRTVATGTGYTAQYRPAVARMYESLATCPDDLLLFFHHVPYGHRLHSGKTVIQFIYDSHYDGADSVARTVAQWRALEGRVDEHRYAEILAQLEYQAGQAEVWRDAVSDWFHRASRISDEKGRVGHHPGRVEAEAMQLSGYSVVDVKPWEAASGGRAISCAVEACSAVARYGGAPGWFTVAVRYFDQNDGRSRFRVEVGSQNIDQWVADSRAPSRRIDAGSSALRLIRGVALRAGDEIRIEGIPDGHERAALDYIEIRPDPR